MTNNCRTKFGTINLGGYVEISVGDNIFILWSRIYIQKIINTTQELQSYALVPVAHAQVTYVDQYWYFLNSNDTLEI